MGTQHNNNVDKVWMDAWRTVPWLWIRSAEVRWNVVSRMGTQQLLVKSWTSYSGNGYILLRFRCVCVGGGGWAGRGRVGGERH